MTLSSSQLMGNSRTCLNSSFTFRRNARPLTAHRLILTATLLAIYGCGIQKDALPTAVERPKHLDQQLQDVRDGKSDVIAVHLEPISTEHWEQLQEVAGSVRQLSVMRGGLNPEQLAQIAPLLTKLERLELGVPVTDEHFRAVVGIASLKILNLSAGEFGDESFARIVDLLQLELLRFSSPHVTDVGLQVLPQVQSLRFLHLIDVPITDAGLEAVGRIEKLESFYLDGGQCTDEGLSKLIQQRPALHFHLDNLHLPDDPAGHEHESTAESAP